MANNNWDDLYSVWGWFLWVGIFLLFFSSMGNWQYTYRAHRKFSAAPVEKEALTVLNERYAKGEIKDDEYLKMKTFISGSVDKLTHRTQS